jgi:hypothetical protein
MSNLKVRPKVVDFSNTSKEYARAEIITRVPVKKMKNELTHFLYSEFKDETRMWMRNIDIIKTEHKIREFDTLSPNGESKLIIYIEHHLNSLPEDKLKDLYVDKVLEGVIPYYE